MIEVQIRAHSLLEPARATMSLSYPALTLVPPLEAEPADAATPKAPHSQTVLRAATVDLREAVREHHAFVWRSVRRLGVPETDVEDAAQRVFLVLAKNLHRVEPRKLRSYLFGVSMRVAANERRSARLRGRSCSDEEANRVPCARIPADEALDRRRARVLLDEILDHLDDELRSVFVLHEFEHVTLAEIAELVGIPPGTAASRLRRARTEIEQHAQRLRAKMGLPGGAR